MYEQNNSCLPLLVAPLFIVVALIMIAVGWGIDNGYLNQTQLTENLPDVVQTVVVEVEKVVVPNGEQQEVVVLPNGDLPQPVTIPQPASMPVAVVQPASMPVMNQPVTSLSTVPAHSITAMQASNPITVTATAQPVITVTATVQPVITVTATAHPQIYVTATPHPATATAAVIVATSAAATVTAMNIVIPPDCYEWKADHCAVWNTPIPSQTPIPTLTQGPSPTPMPTSTQGPPPTVTPVPTRTPTATPENNEISSIVTLQGATNHAGIVVSAVGLGGLEWHELQAPGQAVTNEVGSFKISGLSRGRYKLTAYTTTGSHIPVCMEIDLSGVGSIVIPQTMLSNGGLEVEGDSDNLNLAAQAIFLHKFGLTIPEHLMPILDVSHDGLFDETDYNMIVADPSLMGCRDW